MNKKNKQNEASLGKMKKEDLEKKINKIHFERAEKLNKDREEKIYRENGETFGEYVKKENGWTREHGQNVAKLARFCDLTGKFREDISLMAGNPVDHFVRNHNKRVKGWKIKERYSPKFTPLLEQIVGITIDSVKNDKVKMTPKIVNACNSIITNFLNNENVENTDDLIEKMTKKLKENYENLVAACKEQLSPTIPRTMKSCKHLQEIIAIEKDFLTLKCGCVFRLNKV